MPHVTATQIVPRLWIGTDYSCGPAHEQGFRTLCVLEEPCANPGCHHIAITEKTPLGVVLVARRRMIDRAVDWIVRASMTSDGPVLVHCAAVIERSPLVVAHYLALAYSLPLDEAYDWIKQHRPIVQDRRAWISEE